MPVQLDSTKVKFQRQGHGSKFKVTRNWRCDLRRVVFSYYENSQSETTIRYIYSNL